MKKLLFLTFLLLVTAACSGGGAEPQAALPTIERLVLAKDEAGATSVTAFDSEDTFYLLVDLAGVSDPVEVKAEWTAVEVEGAEANTVLDSDEVTFGNGTVVFDLSNITPWPAGDYRVDVYLAGEPQQTLEFRVLSATAVDSENQAEVVEEGSAAVSTLEMVNQAVIQIEAQGSFTDPEVGNVYNSSGRGSGFIIDPSGIAVTNNHVVTGAALLKVWIDGESEPRNAKILGVSECADLAVIDIDGEGFDYLNWYGGEIRVGLDVYASGFPLGDPEYTLTKGIVSKAQTGGDTSWASIDAVLEHDATINPGNSGGPLVSADGQVVAVNYAGSTDVNQYFAIAQEQALDVIERLQAGEDFLSIGVNGTAVNDGSGLSGVWVSSVKSGSPADEAGVKAGDIITSLEGLILATDGTMADYCDILRSRNSDDVMNIEILRFATEEVLRGQLNGRVLEVSFSFAQTLSDEAEDGGTTTTGGGGIYVDYMRVSDDTGSLSMEVPVEWSDIDGSGWGDGGVNFGPSITAAPILDQLNDNWDVPGVFFATTREYAVITPDETLDSFTDILSEDCVFDSRNDFEDNTYTGKFELWSDCGGEGTLGVVLAFNPTSGEDLLAIMIIVVVSDADLDAMDRILSTFEVR
ncbi:MAG: trypsin-like peptidase domain-containing protein [Ardenticatenaceae bacterium]|nr:trypsin-like peptidase domain-containing protein [Ardenticatenaceae bacterium]